MTDALATWLRLQLDADEQWVDHLPTDADYERCAVTGSLSVNHMRAVRTVTDTWRADLAAKRRLIAYAFADAEEVDGEWGCGHDANAIEAGQCEAVQPESLELLRLLALPYAGRPGYQVQWKP